MQTSDTGRMYSFRLERKDHKKTRLHIAANSAENADRWIGALVEATKCPVSSVVCNNMFDLEQMNMALLKIKKNKQNIKKKKKNTCSLRLQEL